MKTKITLLASLISVFAFAQVPNGGFETWVAGDPANWQTSNNNTQSVINVTQVANSHSGSSAMRMDAWTAGGFWFASVVACPHSGGYFHVNGHSAQLTGWYISNFVSGDKLTVTDVMTLAGTSVGGGTLNITNNTLVYQQFTVPITYNPSNAVPDSAAVGISQYTSTNGIVGLHSGTYVILDDIQLSTPTGIIVPAEQTGIEKIYPNPSNENAWVEYSVTENSAVTLGVYDVNGNLVQTLIQQNQQPGRYKVSIDASLLSSGLYLVRLQTGDSSSMMKFNVTK